MVIRYEMELNRYMEIHFLVYNNEPMEWFRSLYQNLAYILFAETYTNSTGILPMTWEIARIGSKWTWSLLFTRYTFVWDWTQGWGTRSYIFIKCKYFTSFLVTVLKYTVQNPQTGPVFYLLLGVSSDNAQPITGQDTEVPALWSAAHCLSLLRARDRKQAQNTRQLVLQSKRHVCEICFHPCFH